MEDCLDYIGFLCDLEELSKRYNISISHEDAYGSFILHKYNDKDIDWIYEAERE